MPDLGDELQQLRADDVSVIFVFAEGVLARDRLLLFGLPVDAVVGTTEGVVLQRCRCSARAEDRFELAKGRSLQVAAGDESVGTEHSLRLLADAPENANRLRCEKGRDGVRLKGHERETVRLVLLRADFRQQSVWRNADGAGDAAGLADFLPQRFTQPCPVAAMKMQAPGDVEERLVDRDALDIGRVMLEDLEDLVRNLLVEFHVGTDEDRVRATLVGGPRRHRGVDAEAPRLVRAGGDDTALVRTGTDDNGLAAPFGMVQQLDGRVERVHVHMENRRHGKIIPYM